MTRICMDSSTIQGQSQDHVISAFMWYFFRQKTIKHNLAARIAWFGT